MKKYKEYMDGVRVSDTLHQRLLGLEAAGKRPVSWKKCGALAAALALVLGLGGYGMHYYNTMVDPRGEAFLEATLAFDPTAHPDIAIVEPGDETEPGEKTLEGYAVEEERGGVPVVCYYMLPYIDYGGMKPSAASQVAADWDIPAGAARRDLTRDEIIALMGGEDAVDTHLDWGGYELTGWAAWYEDGSFWGAYIMGHAGELDHFEFSVTANQMPPTCIVYSEGVTQEIRGLTITADKYDGEQGCDRRVSFMKDDYGYRFDLTGTDTELTEQRVSRMVCCVADERLALWSADPSAEGGYTCSNCGQFVPAGEKHSHTFIGEGPIPSFVPDYDPTYEDSVPEQDTPAYDPNEAADPFYNAPAAYTCKICGGTYPEGAAHDCAMCDGYPPLHTCEICGETYPEGTAHSHEACGLPLAPDTHACEVCGQALPAGVEHSHQEDHHQDHHSGHH